MVSRASVQRRLLWQEQLLWTMEEASRAKMVLCGSPGDTGVRVNTHPRAAPHVVEAPMRHTLPAQLWRAEEQGGLAIPALTMACHGVV